MRQFVLVCMMFASVVPALVAEPDNALQVFKGKLTVISVGGIETPSRKAVKIDQDRFEVTGDVKLVNDLFRLDGREVEVWGVVTNLFYIGGEGLPLLTVISLSVLEAPDKCGPAIEPELESALGQPGNEKLLVVVTLRRVDGRVSERTEAEFRAFLSQLAADGEHVEVLKTKASSDALWIRASKKAIQAIVDRGHIQAIRLASPSTVGH